MRLRAVLELRGAASSAGEPALPKEAPATSLTPLGSSQSSCRAPHGTSEASQQQLGSPLDGGRWR
jgi:hypothetical protein